MIIDEDDLMDLLADREDAQKIIDFLQEKLDDVASGKK